MYVIVKMVKNLKGVEMPVLILNSDNEVLEFESPESAELMRSIFERNSDSGYKYTIRKIGSNG